MYRPRARRFCPLLVALCVICGCSIGAPIHVWQPAQLESTADQRVLVSTVGEDDDVANQIRQSFIETAPRDVGRNSTFIDASSLQPKADIDLVSAQGEMSSDLTLASLARAQQIDYVLRGEVLEDRRTPQEKTDDQLKVSWRLSSLTQNYPIGGKPVVLDFQTAIERYPDLGTPDLGTPADRQKILAIASAREAHRLVAPSIQQDRVELSAAYLMPGSKQVRRGNVAALEGRWGEAEQIWSDVLAKHPTQVAALHNLALAAAAGQDFSRAKKLARRAIRLRPIKLHQETLVWIELNQRAYHDAFGLPDPPEGWFVTQGDRDQVAISPQTGASQNEPVPTISDPSMIQPSRPRR